MPAGKGEGNYGGVEAFSNDLTKAIHLRHSL